MPKKKYRYQYYMTLEINAKLQPQHRHDIEDIIMQALEKAECGKTDGGGTLMDVNGEVRLCDIELMLKDDSQETIDEVVKIIEDAKVPKGSFLKGEGAQIPIGTLEGLGLYLNGTDLPEETYKNSDVNHVLDKCKELIGEDDLLVSWWQGPTETAIYFYGSSFAKMQEKIVGFLAEYALCQKCRLVQIA